MSKIKKVPLEEVCEIIMGQSPPSEYYNKNKEGLPFFQGKTDFNEIYPTITTYCSKPQKVAEKNDILISVRAPVGPTNVATTKSCIGRGLAAIRAKKIDYKYILYFLRFNENSLAGKGKGSTFEAINREDLESLEIPLPSLDIQQQIAARLEKADELRRMRRYAIEMSEGFLQEVFIDMFGDPVKNPKGWEEKRLEDICIKITDGTHNSPPITSKGKPYITAKHVKENKIDFYLDPWYISKEDHDLIYKRCKPERGDILYIKDGATTGIAAINPYDFEFSMLSSLALLKPNHKVSSATYICAWLNNDYIKRIILKDLAGGAIKRLTLDKIQKIKIFLPPLKHQTKFTSIINYFNKNLSQQREALRQSELLFSSLLNEAFAE